jgi:2-phosphoglycolate phosphatase
MNKPIDTVLFDLDGTLLDTAPDLAFALNSVLIEQQREALAFETIRPWVSHGASFLITNGFQLSDDDSAIPALRKRLIEIYIDNIAKDTDFFEDMEQVLNHLEDQGINWGIVTNKMTYLTEPLLEQLKLNHRSSCTVCGDTLSVAKPDPAPLFHACKLINTDPERCIYIGDAPRDIEAGRAAGMRTLVALYGYIGNEDKPEQWGATDMLQQPLDLLSWLDLNN